MELLLPERPAYPVAAAASAVGCSVCGERVRDGLVFSDGKRCWNHLTEADARRLDTLDDRAAAIGLRVWPYGPNVHVAMRERLLDWAEPLGLRPSSGRCVDWLRAGGCRRRAGKCHVPREGALPAWFDHVSAWSRNGAPAVLVAQPYVLDGPSVLELDRFHADPRLRVEVRPDSWYGQGTTFIGIWRRS